MKEMFQTSDWKTEKHVPVIEILEQKENKVKVRVSVGKEIPHPNTKEHHIAWIQVFFWPEGSPYPVEIYKADFRAHGEYEVFTEPIVEFWFSKNKKGKIIAFSYCNIHGLWKNELEI